MDNISSDIWVPLHSGLGLCSKMRDQITATLQKEVLLIFRGIHDRQELGSFVRDHRWALILICGNPGRDISQVDL